MFSRILLPVLCSAIGLSSPAFAQVLRSIAPAPAAAATDVEFPALAERIGGVWYAHHCAATGTPDRIYGTGQRLADWRGDTIAEARRQADSALRAHADLLGLGDSEFREAIGARMGNCWSLTYQQWYRGLQVIGGRADVRIHRSGVLALLGSLAVPIPAAFDVGPRVDGATATMRAWLWLGQRPGSARQPIAPAAPRLVIWADVDAAVRCAPHLAWEVAIANVDGDGHGVVGRCFVDASDGTALQFVSDKHDCGHARGAAGAATGLAPEATAITPTTVTVLGWTRTGESGVGAPSNVPLAGCVLNVPGVGAVTTDANGQCSINITTPVTITVTNLDGVHCSPILPAMASPASVTVTPGVPAVLQVLTAAATDNELAFTNVLYWTGRVNEFARSVLGNLPELNLLDTILPTVNVANACNAFYVGNTINFYQAGTLGSACNNTAFSSVIAHEWGHGLDDRFGGISNSAVDGLSEGWGDIVAMYLMDSPNIGLDFFTTPGALRSGNNTTQWGTQTEVHAAGESWMGFAWRVRQNLRATLGTAGAVALSNQIVLGTIVANARNQADAVVQVFLADDDDGNLLDGVPHYAELSAAATAHGLPYPQQQIAVLSHTPLLDTTGLFGARGVVARSFAVSAGAINQVLLTWSQSGGAPTSQAMVRDHTTDGYVGLLPGIPVGQVSYHIEAFHSSGYVVRSPAIGDYTYAVHLPPAGPFAGFYLEDFENGGRTWTHGSVAPGGSDDWQIGRVAGFQGTTQGIQWSDPLFAAGGQRIAGNSISGGGGSGGAYQPGSACWLRSPSIDCTGQTGVYLRFRRWLTVQDSQFDQATLFVNGTPIWTNPAGVPLVELQWTQVEYPLPMADNNPSVQLEWRLTSDASFEFGGWAIDDVELGTRAAPTPPPRLSMLPEIVPPHGTVQLSLTGAPNAPLIFVAADDPGPNLVPGLGPVAIGGNVLVSMLTFTDAAGVWTVSAPTQPQAFAWLAYSQVLTLDAGGLVLSNPCANLFLP